MHPDWEVVRQAPPCLVAAVTAYPRGGCSNIVIGNSAFGLEANTRGRLVTVTACTVIGSERKREECKPTEEAGNARILVQAKVVIDLSQAGEAPEPYSEKPQRAYPEEAALHGLRRCLRRAGFPVPSSCAGRGVTCV